MRLTTFTDLSFRVLLLANSRKGEKFNIEQSTNAFCVSRAHLMKVVNNLTKEGYLESIRGRNGGLRLAKEASDIRLGEIVRVTEPDFALVECMRPNCECVLDSACKLKKPLREATQLFIDHLNTYTLTDISLDRELFEHLAGAA